MIGEKKQLSHAGSYFIRLFNTILATLYQPVPDYTLVYSIRCNVFILRSKLHSRLKTYLFNNTVTTLFYLLIIQLTV